MRHFGSIAVMVALAAACGGKSKSTAEPPRDPDEWKQGQDESLGEDPPPSSVGTVDAQTLDQIKRSFERRGTAVSRCLAMVVDNKELPKNSHGKITLSVIIAPGGKPGEIKVLKATLESKSLNDCILDRVREIQFPEVTKPTPTTYTYAFEAM